MLEVNFDRRLNWGFHGSKVTSVAGLLADQGLMALATVAMPKGLFGKVLGLIDGLRPRLTPALAGAIEGRMKAAGGV